MVDNVLVRNDVTGHTYKFACGRWLGRGVDDGSTERLLVGNLLSPKKEEEENRPTGSLGRSTPRTRSPTPSPRSELNASELQYMLGECVNNIVKWRYTRNSERHTTLTALLCSEDGLVQCLENVFLLGFKSARMFVGKNYLWDYFVRVKDQFEQNLMDELSGNKTASLERNHQETVAVWRCYCHLIDEIRHTSKNLGKDGKFQLFICLGVRYVMHSGCQFENFLSLLSRNDLQSDN
ncbi:DENN domain-containing protein 5B-like [Euwallacea similis]|uniref:DENN domain-containing protein 5B-like n=1 Tax=Euwallacea similis TaxID=1736056 RepID=UPI00344B481C